MEAKKTLGVRRTKIINGWVIDPIRVDFKLRVAYILVVEFKLRVADILVVKVLEFELHLMSYIVLLHMFVSHVLVGIMRQY